MNFMNIQVTIIATPPYDPDIFLIYNFRTLLITVTLPDKCHTSLKVIRLISDHVHSL